MYSLLTYNQYNYCFCFREKGNEIRILCFFALKTLLRRLSFFAKAGEKQNTEG